MYTSFTGEKFWDEVDKVLDSMKSMPDDKRFRYVAPPGFIYSRSLRFLSSCLKAILSRDRRTYGVAPGDTAAVPSDNATTAGGESLVQRRIEDCIDIAPGAVAVA